jgi:hypothetical protein
MEKPVIGIHMVYPAISSAVVLIIHGSKVNTESSVNIYISLLCGELLHKHRPTGYYYPPWGE